MFEYIRNVGETVQNSFMITVNSNDCLWDESYGHASVAINNIGKHLAQVNGYLKYVVLLVGRLAMVTFNMRSV